MRVDEASFWRDDIAQLPREMREVDEFSRGFSSYFKQRRVDPDDQLS